MMVIIALLCMTACGDQQDSESSQSSSNTLSSATEEPQTPDATEAVDQFMTAIKDQDENAMQEVYAGDSVDVFLALDYEELNDSLDEQTLQLFDEKMHDFTYEIGEVTTEGDTATAEVTITTRDFGTLMREFLGDYYIKALKAALKGKDDGPIMDAAVERLKEQLPTMEPTREGSATLTLHLTDGKWVVDDVSKNTEFLEALSGGCYSAFEDTNAQLSELTE